MQTAHIFDIDGTLTPPRRAMPAELVAALSRLCRMAPVYLATGSDRNKVESQVPADILNMIEGLFTCNGAVFECKGRIVHRHEHRFPDALIDWLDAAVSASPYPLRCGNHIEVRTGLLNVSVVGRNASSDQRKAYMLWDQVHRERHKLVCELHSRFRGYEASAGGEISIDIAPHGCNKARILPVVAERHPDAAISFTGDRMKPGGNDWPLAQALHRLGPPHRAVAVSDWRQTSRNLRAELTALADLSA